MQMGDEYRVGVKKIAAKKSVFYMWIISYLLVLVLPLMMSQLFYRVSSKALERNAESVSRTSLQQMAASLERVSADIAAIGQELTSRKEVESLSYAEGPLTNIKRERIRDLQSELQVRCAGSNYITDIFILFPHSGMVASTKGFFKTEADFDGMLRREYSFSLANLQSWYAGNRAFQIQMLGSGAEAQRLVAHMTTAISGELSEVVVLFSLDVSQLRRVLESELQSGGYTPCFWAVSPEGLILTPAVSRSYALSIPIEPAAGERTWYADADERLVLSAMPLQEGGWTIVSAAFFREYTAQLKQIRFYYLIYLAICIIVGLGFSFFLAKRNYTPVRRLAGMLSQTAASPEAEGEFAQLEKGLSALLTRSQEYERELDQQKKSLRQSSMARMLRGSLHSDQAFEAACADYDMAFSSKQFSVVGILLRDYQNLFLDGKADESEQTQELAYFVVTSVTEELLREYCDAYLCQMDTCLYAILSPKAALPDAECEAFTARIREICGRAEAFIRERLGILTTFYVSSIYTARKTGMWGIHLAYEEVQWGMEQIEGFRLEAPVLGRADMKKGDVLPASLSAQAGEQKRRQFAAAVQEGDFDAADALYLELRGEGLAQVEKSFSAIRVQTIFLLDYLVSALDAKQLELCQEEIGRLLARIRQAQHIDELAHIIHEAAVCVHGAMKTPGISEDPGVGLQIARYINDHYQEPDLTVVSVAEQFGMSPSYMLRVFKKDCSASGVLDYIHQRRVDTAKLLLREGSDTVEHIAEAVGYSNGLALIRAFKRLEGITPTAYRKLVAAKENEDTE